MDTSPSSDAELLTRIRALDELLPTLAGVLDVRQVFERIAGIANRVIPHDMAALIVIDAAAAQVTLHAVAGGTLRPAVTVAIPAALMPRVRDPWEQWIVADAQEDPETRDGLTARAGFRGVIRVPIRSGSVLVAMLEFSSRTPSAYDESVVLLARRIADHIALALSHEQLAEEARRAAEARERAALLQRRVNVLTAEVDALGGHRRVIGESKAWQDVLRKATQVATTDTTVLLLGESGTGKEVLARFIHRASARSNGPFVAINCAALPEQLLESELFGHERGAFTGAVSPKPGQLELAASGVLFLDEVSEMSPTAQAKFLRVLQEREFQRVGGTRVLKSNVRVVAATNRDLPAAIGRGAFREDLYYRLNVFEIVIPPLRARPDDVLPLSEAFLQDIGRAFGRPPAGISREARQLLLEYAWPGNVRQLRNTLERAAILCDGGLITGEHLSLPAGSPSTIQPARSADDRRTGGAGSDDVTGDLKSLERAAIASALERAKHNKSKAARLLGLTRTQLYVRLRKYGLDA